MFVVLIRTLLLYVLLIVGMRLLGKRQIGELEPSELVLALLISDLAAVPMQDNGIPLLFGVIPILVLLSLSSILSVLTVRSIPFRTLLCGRPSVVIRSGQIVEEELRKNRLTLDELLEELRGQGYADFSTVSVAVLETNGQLSVLPYAADRPATAEQMGVSTREGGLPVVLISDGRLLSHNLKGVGRDRKWLDGELARRKLLGPEQVLLMTVDDSGQICCLPRKGAGK